ncbi:MAG: hypothetical protein ACHP65_09445, partial [Legionellales bacterium]
MNLSACEPITGFLKKIRFGQLNHLKEILLSRTDITASDLERLFQMAPKLEKIDIGYCPTILDLKNLVANKPMYNLKEIDLSRITTAGILEVFFNITPAIEKIHLAYSKDISAALEHLRPQQLPHLNEVNFYQANITATALECLLKAAPKIKKITLSHAAYLKGAFSNLLSKQLSALEEIDLSHTDIDANDIEALFRAAPALKKINLMHIKNGLSCIEAFSPNQLNNLKEINLLGTYATKASIIHLFAVAPSLEKVNFNLCHKMAGSLEQIKPEYLVNLHTIDLMLTDITANDLYCLLNAASSLREINLRDAKNITGGFEHLQPGQLSNLETIHLSYYEITEEDRVALLKAAPFVLAHIGSEAAKKPVQEKLDVSFFNTKSDTPPEMSYTEYFPNVVPQRYRLNVWHPHLDTLQAGPDVFNSLDFHPIALDKTNYSSDESFCCQKGVKPVQSQDGTTIILPSLDVEETLFDLQVVNAYRKLIDISTVKIHYNADARFYSVTLPEAGDYTIHYQVAIPGVGSKPELPSGLALIIKHYNAYGIDQQPLEQKFSTLGEFATYLRKNQVGSCMHRSIAAYQELQNQYQDVRIVQNDLHAFIEIKINDSWYTEDLGGYPAILKKVPMKVMAVLDDRGIVSHHPLEMVRYSLDEVLNQPTRPALILTTSDLDVQYFYSKLCQTTPAEHVFIAHHPEALSLTAQGITITGEIKTAHTAFNQWLKAHSDTVGVVCVDIREFNASELAQLNDLLDRTIEHQKLPENVRIVLIDNQLRGYYGPDFRRRVPSKTTVESPKEACLLAPIESMPEHSKQVVEIDLFNSCYWQRSLMGAWQLYKKPGEQDFSFQWQPGKLLEALSYQHVILKNPPLFDPNFTTFIAELQSLKRIEWADQVTTVPQETCFYQSTGFDWQGLSAHASLHHLSAAEAGSTHVLSDVNILSFIQDPCYGFSQETNQLESQDSWLTTHQKQRHDISIVCAPGLSEGALAEVLTAAIQRNVRVRFLLPDKQKIPENSPLHRLKFAPEQAVSAERADDTLATWVSPSVSFQLSDDLYFSARQQLQTTANATCFDLSCLEATELGRVPVLPETIRADFLATGKLSMQ